MKQYLKILVYLCLLTHVIYSKHSPKSSSPQKSQKDDSSTITCECGKKGKTVRKRIEMDMAEEIFQKEAFASLNKSEVVNYSPTILRLLKKCSSCEISYTRCYGDPEDFEEYFCHKNSARIAGSLRKLSISYNGTDFSKTIKLSNKSLTNYPEEVDIPVGGLPHQRRKRQLESCAYPTSLQTSELKCKIYPSTVKCIQKCAIGFTLSKGTEVMRVCKQKDNVWKPGSFQECMPYLDCSLTLVSGGSKTCSTPTTSHNVKCDVRCEPYEDKLGTSEQSYSCDTDGKWSPKLPFCVQAGSGLDLAVRPGKGHKNGTDPYYYMYNF